MLSKRLTISNSTQQYPPQDWRKSSSCCVATLSPHLAAHRPWHHTGPGSTQALAAHRPWQHTGPGTTQALAAHRRWQHTGPGSTQALATHRPWQHTGPGNTQALAAHKLWHWSCILPSRLGCETLVEDGNLVRC